MYNKKNLDLYEKYLSKNNEDILNNLLEKGFTRPLNFYIMKNYLEY